jgi:hypothetical protein
MTSLTNDLELAQAKEICTAVELAIFETGLNWKISFTLESPEGNQYKYYIKNTSKEE